MKHDLTHGQKGKKWRICLLASLATILFAAAVYWALFLFNRPFLDFELTGGKITLEYGRPYQEPGFRVLLRGSKFWRGGVAVAAHVERSGRVDSGTLGSYYLHYRARFLGMEAEAFRTVCVADTQPPVITLTPDNPSVELAQEYHEAGFSAYDNYDGDITDQVMCTRLVGKIIYSVADSSGNMATAERDIPVFDDYPPALLLNGGSRITAPLGETFQDPGYIAADLRDGDLTAQVSVSIDHPFVRYEPDVYRLTYRVTDSDGNETVTERTLTTVPRMQPAIVYPEGKTIYLTFDDGPGADTGRLLDVLKRYNVQATFFVVDTGHPELLRRIVNEGHSIGIHTRSHRYQQIYASPEAYFQDVFAMQQIIRDATGVQTWLLRFPGGSSNTVSRGSKGIMTYLTQAVQTCGFSYFDWNVDSGDAGGADTSAKVFLNVVNGVEKNECCVVLQHDIHSFSVDAVESIIRWGQANGYRFLPLQANSPAIRHAVQN